MGVVYEAIDTTNGGRVALKTLAAMDPRRVLGFKDEFRSLSGFSHPNVATLYELLSTDDQWFITMEFIDGVSFLESLWTRETAKGAQAWSQPTDDTPTLALADAAEALSLARRAGTLGSLDRLREAARQLAEAVAALHAAGILHRDLKPSNVMIGPEDRLVVLDFGLVERLDKRVVEGPASLSGTIPYMAPEQAAGRSLNEAADWYAVGVMLYEALSGQRPFEGPPAKVLQDKQNLNPPPLPPTLAELDPELAQLCMDLVQLDPARRPSGAEVLARLAGSLTGAAPGWHTAPRGATSEQVFVGRQSHLGILSAAFQSSGLGATTVALIVGKSGMGKSALVAHFLDRLRQTSDPLILTGRCYEKESLPFKALDSVVDSLARHLAGMPADDVRRLIPRGVAALSKVFPVLSQVEAFTAIMDRIPLQDSQELRYRAFTALRELLARLSDLRRVVVYIDDVQWGDSDSAVLLRHLLQPPDAPELFLIVSCREEYEERGELVSFLLAQPGSLRLPVGPLTMEESCLLAAKLHNAPAENAGQIARESGGSPYFIQELRESLGQGEASIASLDAVLRRRVGELPAGARHLVEVAAVSGRPLPERDACRAAGLAGEDQRLLAMLRAQRLIRGADGAIEPYHDRVREAVVAGLDPATLKLRHLALATTLEGSGADAEAIASHLVGAGESARAVPYLIRAAERASAALAFDQAAQLLTIAVRLSQTAGNPGEAPWRLSVKLAEALANAGRGLEAARAFGEAAGSAPEAEAIELERKQAYWYTASGYMAEGEAAFLKVLRRVGIRVPPRRLLPLAILALEIRLRFTRMSFRPRLENLIPRADLNRIDAAWDAARGFVMIDTPMGIYFTGLSLLMALRAGDAARIAPAMHFHVTGSVSLRGLPVRRGLNALLAACDDLTRSVGTPYAMTLGHFTAGLRELCLGHWRAAFTAFEEATRLCREGCPGAAWELASSQDFHLLCLQSLGRYNDLRRQSEVLAAEATQRGNRYQVAVIAMGIQPFCQIIAGQPEEGLRMLDGALREWSKHGYFLANAFAAKSRIDLFLYLGRAREAWDEITAEWPLLRKHLYLRLMGMCQFLYYSRGQCALALACQCTAGERSRLLRSARKDAKWLRRDRTLYAHAFADLLLAGCAALEGRRAEAEVWLQRGSTGLDSQSMPILAATVRWRLGQLTGGQAGDALCQQAELLMRAEGVREPERFAAVFVNCFTATQSPL